MQRNNIEAENLEESNSSFGGKGEEDLVRKSTEDTMLGERDIRYPQLESTEDDAVKEDGEFSASLSPWDLGGLTSGSAEGRGFNSRERASSSGASLNSVSSETSSRTPPGGSLGTQDSPNPGSFSSRVTSQRSIVTSSMSMTSVGGGSVGGTSVEGGSSDWGKELWESLQIGTPPPTKIGTSPPPISNNPMRDQSSHNKEGNDERRPNNKFNVNPTITGSSNVATFLQPERSLADDIDKSDERQKYSDFAVNSDQPPAERVNENLDDYLEPELGLQFPLGDPIVGSAVQDLDISLVSPTTEPSYLLKTTQPTQLYYPPIQNTNLLKTTSFEPNYPPRTTKPSQSSQDQPSTTETLSPTSESKVTTTLSKSTPTPLISSPTSPTPVATTKSESRFSPRYKYGPAQFWEWVKV